MIDTKTNTVAEWLAAWDRGEEVPSVEMGGMGADYEHALQICAFECVRFVLANEAEFRRIIAMEKEEDRLLRWRAFDGALDAAVFSDGQPCKDLGLSGKQVAKAKNLCNNVMRRGLAAMDEPVCLPRRITINKEGTMKTDLKQRSI